jgi:hypothetical protein
MTLPLMTHEYSVASVDAVAGLSPPRRQSRLPLLKLLGLGFGVA